MSRLKNIHPGEILLEEFMIPLEITAYKLAKDIDVPQTRISEIIKEKRRITADTAIRLSNYFGNSAKFWLGLQDDYDIEFEKTQKELEFKNKKKTIEDLIYKAKMLKEEIKNIDKRKEFCLDEIERIEKLLINTKI